MGVNCSDIQKKVSLPVPTIPCGRLEDWTNWTECKDEKKQRSRSCFASFIPEVRKIEIIKLTSLF